MSSAKSSHISSQFFKKNSGLVFGCFLFLLLICICGLSYLFPLGLPQLEQKLTGPFNSSLLGLDSYGLSVLHQTLRGGAVSLSVSFIVVISSLSIGLIIGTIAGYKRGWVDLFLTAVMDMIYTFPGFLLALSLVAIMGPSFKNLVLALTINGWAGFARVIRGEVIKLKTHDSIEASKALGSTPIRIILKNIWPQILGLMCIQCSFAAAGVIISEAGLSFLGVGLPPTLSTWGHLLNQGKDFLIEAPYICLVPGFTLFAFVLSLNLIGDGLRDLLDPKT